MKLYSRDQVLKYIAITIAAAVMVTVIGFLVFYHPGNTEISSSAEQNSPTLIPENHSSELDYTLQEVNFNGSYSPLPDYITNEEEETIDIYRRLNAAVVNITTIVYGYNWFLEPIPQEGGSGSGSIIDQEGHVLTNYHVIKDADSVSIILADGSEYKGETIGIDPENDLAIVKFDPMGKHLTTIPFGTSKNLAVGQKVLAIGNPFGLERTLTQGIVSAVRAIKNDNGLVLKEAIQTDASINPGNSGGPLLNSRGELIGVNTMIYSPSGGSVGIGFAVPVDTARRIIPDLMQFGKVNRGWIDITPIQLFPSLVRYAQLPVDKGLLVSKVEQGSNAQKAGIKGGNQAVRYGRTVFYIGGDVIVEADGMTISSIADLYSALEDNKPGEKVKIVVVRGSQKVNLEVILSERPSNYSL
ncbi:MAG: trypsin-like peptidase domain-containing protein [Spirochaetales bacterium]|nr:trypsin-like peptidase domain-containing protein [Spirochaetales bacterium]